MAGGRDEEAYEAALQKQAALRAALVQFMDEHDVAALAYPTMRQEVALIDAAPVGSSCQMAAHSGLPAISAPAGFTPRNLPVGIELMGRPFDDARLVAFAYALEQATSPRAAPHRTPPLVEGRAPAPVRFSVSGDAGFAGRVSAVRLEASFALDAPEGTLEYVISTTGVAATDLHAIVLQRRGSGQRPNAVVHRFAGPGHTGADGALDLTAKMLDDVLAGRLELALYTADEPLGAVRLPLQP